MEEIKTQYSYCVKPRMIFTGIQFLQSQLPVIHGKVVDRKIYGHLFRIFPVHSSGGKSLKNLFEAYSLNFTNTLENRVGRKNSVALGKILCKKGEIKTGFSSYYVELHDAD